MLSVSQKAGENIGQAIAGSAGPVPTDLQYYHCVGRRSKRSARVPRMKSSTIFSL